MPATLCATLCTNSDQEKNVSSIGYMNIEHSRKSNQKRNHITNNTNLQEQFGNRKQQTKEWISFFSFPPTRKHSKVRHATREE